MSMTLQEVLKMDVTTPWEAEAWIKALVDNGFIWHLEDSPEEVINGRTGESLFQTEDDIASARQRAAACFALLDDPFETIVTCEWEDEVDPEITRMNMLIDRGMSATDAQKFMDDLPPLDKERRIEMFFHCGKCVEEIKDGSANTNSPREYGSYEIGYTVRGIQVWCVRHECNVVSIDFQGYQHPAV